MPIEEDVMVASSDVPRDEALLQALAGKPRSIGALVAATGMGERRCERGLRRLQDAGFVFRAWPLYRLTTSGRAMLPEVAAIEPAAPRRAAPARTPARAADRPLDVTL
jgi:predicted transcriptional regulator